MSLDWNYEKSKLVQVMGWCRQAITSGNVDPDLCHHMVSIGHNELNIIIIYWFSVDVVYFLMSYRKSQIVHSIKGTCLVMSGNTMQSISQFNWQYIYSIHIYFVILGRVIPIIKITQQCGCFVFALDIPLLVRYLYATSALWFISKYIFGNAKQLMFSW